MAGDPADSLREVAFDWAGTEQFAVRAELPLPDGGGQGFLVLEVLVNRSGRAADALGDLLDGGREVALGVQLEQGVNDRLSGALTAQDRPSSGFSVTAVDGSGSSSVKPGSTSGS